MSNLKHNDNIKRIFVISAPSGTGKTTLVNKFLSVYGDKFEKTISCTTREPREEETLESSYYFVSKDDFNELLGQNVFLEHAEVFGNKYGTKNSEITRIFNLDKEPILIIDTQGAINIKKQGLPCVMIFIKPPTLDTLYTRLIKRGSETKEVINKRILKANEEIEQSVFYDYIIINNDFQLAYNELTTIILKEASKR